MPELPEVETVTRDLNQSLKGLRVVNVRVLDGRVIRGLTPVVFVKRLKGKVVNEIYRRGKAIICRLDDQSYLIVQLMMTGQMVVTSVASDVPAKETKIVFELSNGSCLNYNDQRLFGRLSVVQSLEDIPYFKILGPEPFDAAFTPGFLQDSLKTKSAPIKSALMDHRLVAGIGNIYASEILFRSRIDPRRGANRLKSVEIKRVHQVTLQVLQEAIELRGSSMRNYLDGAGQKGTFNQRIQVYAREGEPCTHCGEAIFRIVQNGRSTFFCHRCQK